MKKVEQYTINPMEANYIDLEKDIYLEALNKDNIYKEYLYSLFYDAELNKKVTSEKIVEELNQIKNARILPILTSSDSDKSLLYESIRAGIQNQVCLLIPLCPIDERILHHIYNCFIEEFGLEILDNLSPNSKKIRKNDVIKALIEYQHSSTKKDLLRKWFLNFLTEEEEMTLGMSTSIIDDENSLEMIKYMCESFKAPVLLFFEDIELINHKYGAEYGEKWGVKAETVFLNILYSLFTKISNVVIILPCIKTSWIELLKFSNESLLSVLEPEFEFFDFEGLKRKIMIIMDLYWLRNKIRPPGNPFFPLNEALLETLFKKSNGNLKKFFILCIKSIQEILDGEKLPAAID